MSNLSGARHICYVTMDAPHALVGKHIGAGGRAVVLAQGKNGAMITIHDEGVDIPVVPAGSGGNNDLERLIKMMDKTSDAVEGIAERLESA